MTKRLSNPIIEDNSVSRLDINNTLETNKIDTILDEDWFDTVMVSRGDSFEDSTDAIYRFWSSVELKFTDASIGGNIGINPRPMFTPYADIPSKGRGRGREDVSPSNISGNYGMGRYYSEAIDDNANTIFMRFGVPQFTSLSRFLTIALDRNQAKLANTGRVSATLIGKALGGYILLTTFPAVALFYVVGKFVSNIIPPSSSKYYTLKPTMHLYWSAVNTLVTSTAVNMGLLPKFMTNDEGKNTNKSKEANKEIMSLLREALPNIVTEDNYIDVMAIALRAQRLENEAISRHLAFLESDPDNGYVEHMMEYIDNPAEGNTNASFADMIQRELKNPANVGSLTKSVSNATDTKKVDIIMERDPLDIASLTEEEKDKILEDGNDIENYLNTLAASAKASWVEGSQYLPFRVDHVDTISESFSTSVKENDLQMSINGKASGSRSHKFSLAGGNIADNAIVDFLEGAVGYAVDVVAGVAETLTFGLSNAISVLLGGGYIDVPKQWDNSSVELPTMTYNVKLISPYGNPVSLLTNVYIPLLTLMAGIMPLATGKASYTSPFLINLEHPGRASIPLGMMTSLNITRGASELSFNKDNRALAIDVSFTIVDLSTIMAMPVSTGSIFGVDMTLDEDNVLSRYLSTLAGQDIASRFYTLSMAKANLARLYFKKEAFTSPAGMAFAMMDTSLGRMARILAPRSEILKNI